MAPGRGDVRNPRRLSLLVLSASGLVLLFAYAPFPSLEYWAVDLGVYRAAGGALLHGANPYDPQVLVEYADGAEIGGRLVYSYPPVFALLVSPLSLLPFAFAARIWLAVNIALIYGSVFLSLHVLDWGPSRQWLLSLLFGVAGFVPTIHLLVPGQGTAVVLLFLTLSLLFLKRRRLWVAGAALALCLVKPNLVTCVLVFMLLKGYWSALLSLGMTAVLTIAPFYRLLPGWIDAALKNADINLGFGGYLNSPTLNSLAVFLMPTPKAELALAAALVLGVVCTNIWLVRRTRSDPTPAMLDQLFAYALTSSLLIAGYARTHDLVLLLLPGLVVARTLARQGTSGRTRKAVVVMGVLAYALPYAQAIAAVFVPLLEASLWHVVMPCLLAVSLFTLAVGNESPVDLPTGEAHA